MLKNNVLVRKLVGIETAGSLNILFTDKTGTITKGNLEVIGVKLGNGIEFNNIIELNKYANYKEHIVNGILYNSDSTYDIKENKVIGGNITDKSLIYYLKMQKVVKYMKNINFPLIVKINIQ